MEWMFALAGAALLAWSVVTLVRSVLRQAGGACGGDCGACRKACAGRERTGKKS